MRWGSFGGHHPDSIARIVLRLEPDGTATDFKGRETANPNTKPGLIGHNDARTGMPLGIPRGAMCVQRFDDSLNSAIHITYRISLRSSSMPEPRDPLLKVLNIICYSDGINRRVGYSGGHGQPEPMPREAARQRNKEGKHGFKCNPKPILQSAPQTVTITLALKPAVP